MNSYQTTLKQLFQEFDDTDPDAQLANITSRIMMALQNNLDGKSKQYKDPALTQLFLMNNIHYIVRSVRRFVLHLLYFSPDKILRLSFDLDAIAFCIIYNRSEAKEMLGDDWVQIHRRIVQQHANQYKRISWAKVNPLKLNLL